MRSVMKHNFSQVPRANIPRSAFKRNHGYKTTFDAGYLIPVYVDEALPGDTINLDMTAFARLATPLHPFMDNLRVDSFFFAVPNRLLWQNWERFNGSQDNPTDSTDYLIPQINSGDTGGYANGTIHDYFGLPTGVTNLEHSALWHRAYNLIFNEWFRDENLQDSVPVNTDDGPDTPADYTLLRRGKRHDYFTSCLPWPQKGPAVSIPLGEKAPVAFDGPTIPANIGVRGNNADIPQQYRMSTANPNHLQTSNDLNPDPNYDLYADLGEATAATINVLRQAFQIQKLFERDARGGTRYIEILKSHFGVTSPDARLQRPEYLGGGSSRVNVNAIAQTSETSTESPQGNLAAVGTFQMNRHGFTKSFVEHCTIIGLVSARADLTYQEGLDRMWSRKTRWDFYWPALAHIGEQAVLNKEIYAQGNAADDDVFGYQERFAEYRYKQSKITGQFRSSFAQSLDTWHLSQDFGALPVLNDAFIQDDPPIDRVIAIPSYPHFLFDSYFNISHVRPLPTNSVPGYIDHF